MLNINMEVEDDKICSLDLQQPEILSKEGIIEILSQRHVNTIGFEHFTKDHLIDIYYRHVIPRPQRTYRKNRRGQVATKNQILVGKRKRTYTEMVEGSKELNTGITTATVPKQITKGLVNSFNLPENPGGRIKPPPSAINFNRKVISLSSKKPSTDNATKPSTHSEPKLSIPIPKQTYTVPKTVSIEKTEDCKAEITKKDFGENGQQHLTIIKPIKDSEKPRAKIKLKRPGSITISSPPPRENDEPELSKESEQSKEEKSQEHDEDVAVVTKKFKKISWP